LFGLSTGLFIYSPIFLLLLNNLSKHYKIYTKDTLQVVSLIVGAFLLFNSALSHRYILWTGGAIFWGARYLSFINPFLFVLMPSFECFSRKKLWYAFSIITVTGLSLFINILGAMYGLRYFAMHDSLRYALDQLLRTGPSLNVFYVFPMLPQWVFLLWITTTILLLSLCIHASKRQKTSIKRNTLMP
jgi:hypothetical protein